MNASPNVRAKHLSITAATLIAIAAVAGAWVLPTTADAGPTLSVSIEPPTAEAETAPAVTIDWVKADARAVGVNIPLSQIQDGQFCQAYATVSGVGGSVPYDFTWSGQFSNAYASSGPLGPLQIVSGNVSSGRALSLSVVVRDSVGGPILGQATASPLQIGAYPYNSSCEA